MSFSRSDGWCDRPTPAGPADPGGHGPLLDIVEIGVVAVANLAMIMLACAAAAFSSLVRAAGGHNPDA